MNTKRAKSQSWLSKLDEERARPDEETLVYGERLKDGYRGDAYTHIIYHDKQYDLRRLKFSCKTKSPAVAYRYAPAKVKQLLMTPEEKKAAVRILIRDTFEKFIKDKEKEIETEEIKQSTLFVIKRSIKKMDPYFGDSFVEEFERDDWDDVWRDFCEWFKKTYPGEKGRGEDISNVVKYMSALVRILHNNGTIKKRPRIWDPDKKKREKTAKKTKLKVLSRLQYVMSQRRAPRTERLVIRLGGDLAFRISSDCLSLKEDQLILDGDDPRIKIEGDDKASYFVEIPISKSLARSIKNYMRDFPNPMGNHIFWQPTKPEQALKSQQVKTTKYITKAAGWGTHHRLRDYRLSQDFGNPIIPPSDTMIFRRVSYQVALKHYIKPSAEARERMRANSK